MDPFSNGVDFCPGIAESSLLDSVFVDFEDGGTWLECLSPGVDLFDVIVFEGDDGFVFFDGFGCGVVVEDGLVGLVLDVAPVVLLELWFGVGWTHLLWFQIKITYNHKN